MMNKPQYELIEEYKGDDENEKKVTYIIAKDVPKTQEPPEFQVNQIRNPNFIDEFEDLSLESTGLYSGSNDEEDYLVQVHTIMRKKKMRKNIKTKKEGIDID